MREPDAVAPRPWDENRPKPVRERAINIPAGVAVVIASILGGYLLQSRAPDPDAVVRALGLTPDGIARGQLWRLASVLVVHGSWTHAGLNALGALAFGAAVARRLRTVAAFLLFYLTCGVAASLGYVAVHWGGQEVLVGASGAISGLMGATSRLLGSPSGPARAPDGRPALQPFTSRTVIGMAAAWSFINLLMAMGWLDVGSHGEPIAWEAHLFGYAAGLLLIAPADAIAARLHPAAGV